LLLPLVFAAPPERITRTTQRVVDLINSADDAALQQMFAPEMNKAFPPAKTATFLNQVRHFGKIEAIAPMRVEEDHGRFRLITPRGPLLLDLALNAQGQISGLSIKPAGSELQAQDRNATPLKLPFRNEWLVVWGGPTVEQNIHHDQPNQRFALDLVMVGPGDKSYSDDGVENSDYYCYGRDIYAPGPGEVVMVVDGVPDNTPGSMNPYAAMGNCVMIKHASNEYSVLAHFQPATIKVKKGQKVKAGDLIGKCGNSGNSSEPHLHYHLQNTEVFQDGLGITPCFDYVRVRQGTKILQKKDYSPVQGDKIAPM